MSSLRDISVAVNSLYFDSGCSSPGEGSSRENLSVLSTGEGGDLSNNDAPADVSQVRSNKRKIDQVWNLFTFIDITQTSVYAGFTEEEAGL